MRRILVSTIAILVIVFSFSSVATAAPEHTFTDIEMEQAFNVFLAEMLIGSLTTPLISINTEHRL